MSSRNPYLLDPNANPNLQGGNPFMIPAPDSGSIMQPAFLSQAQNDMPQNGVQSPSSYLRNGTLNSARIQNTGTILSAGWNDTSSSNNCSCAGSSDPSGGSQLPTIANRMSTPEFKILTSDPTKILWRSKGHGGVLDPFGNDLGDNPFGDASDGGPYSGGGGGPDPGNWLGPGSSGSGGDPTRQDATKLAFKRWDFDSRFNDLLSDFTRLSQLTLPSNGSPNFDAIMNIIVAILAALGQYAGNKYVRTGIPIKPGDKDGSFDLLFEGLDWSDIGELEKRWNNLDTLEKKIRQLLASLQLGLIKIPNDQDGKKFANYVDRLNTMLDILGNEKTALSDWLRTHKK